MSHEAVIITNSRSVHSSSHVQILQCHGDVARFKSSYAIISSLQNGSESNGRELPPEEQNVLHSRLFWRDWKGALERNSGAQHLLQDHSHWTKAVSL